MSLSFFFQPQFRIFNQPHHFLLFKNCKSFTVSLFFLCGWNPKIHIYFKTTWLKQGSLSACFTFEPKKRFGGATWLFLKIKHKNGNWCLPLGQSHVESPPPPSFIVYIHTPGKVVILQRPSLFLTSLSVRKFISSEIGRFQLCGGNLTNIIRLESLGTCVMSSSFWISLSTRCVAYWWKPRKSAVCF